MKVKAKHPFRREGKDVKPGDVLDVPDHEAQQLHQQGHVEHHEEEQPQGPGSTPQKDK